MKHLRRVLFVFAFGSMPLLAQPVITQQPTNQVVPMGSSASVSVTATGDNLTYQWFKDGVRLMSQTNSTLNFASFQFTNCGSYLVVITNVDGMAISLPALLSAANAPLKAWGYNNYGQLGNGMSGFNANSSLPVNITSNVVAAAAGYYHSLSVKSDGTLWAMGDNEYGQLGIGTIAFSTNQPVNVSSNVVAVAASGNDSFFVKSDGTLWGMGFNYDGELGVGTTASNNLPVKLSSNVVAVAAGGGHALFVKSDGTLWAMGFNHFGQLGNGTTGNSSRPVNIASNVVAVAGGNWHSLFVQNDGTLWAMGFNYYGQLGNGTTANSSLPVSVASNVVAVAAGYFHSLFVKSDGTLWAMGYNYYGQLGNGISGMNANSSLPVSVASNVVAVAAGENHSLFVKSDGTLWAMGYNKYGQTFDGIYYGIIPTQIAGLTIASLGTCGVAEHSLVMGAFSPQISGPINQAANFGQTANFSVTITNGDGPFTYQWQLNGTNLLNATNASYSIANTVLTDAGIYSVTVTGLVGTASQSAALTVNILPPAMSLKNVIQTDGGLQLTMQLTGSPNYPYILQMATNLTPPVDWHSIFTNPADANGNWSFTVTNLPDLPAGYYRALGQ